MTERSVGVMVLAAGGSSRMGSPKALLKVDDVSLLRRSAQAAVGSGCRPVVVVLGANADQLAPELAGLDVTTVKNASWQKGMSGSLQVGLRALGPVDAALVTLCDQPHVTGELLRMIASIFRAGTASLLACEYGGSLGVPALFSRGLFPEILALSGDQGAKVVLQAHAGQAIPIPFPLGAVDIDTADDYARLTTPPSG